MDSYHNSPLHGAGATELPFGNFPRSAFFLWQVFSSEGVSIARAVWSPIAGMTWPYVSSVMAMVVWPRSSWTNFR